MALTLPCRGGLGLRSPEVPALAKPLALCDLLVAARLGRLGLLGPVARPALARPSFFLPAGGEPARTLDDPLTGQPLPPAGLLHVGPPTGRPCHGRSPPRSDHAPRLLAAPA